MELLENNAGPTPPMGDFSLCFVLTQRMSCGSPGGASCSVRHAQISGQQLFSMVQLCGGKGEYHKTKRR